MIKITKPKFFLSALLLSVLVIALDQYSKQTALDFFASHDAPHAVTPFFNLVLVFNKGISFGLFNGGHEYGPLMLTILALVITGVLFIWLMRTESRLVSVALGLAIGGAIGNIIDRFAHGAVVDFLDFHAFGYHWPAFNVADSAVVCGAGLLLIASLVFDTENRQ